MESSAQTTRSGEEGRLVTTEMVMKQHRFETASWAIYSIAIPTSIREFRLATFHLFYR